MWVRLLLISAATLAVGVAMFGYFAHQAATAEFERFLTTRHAFFDQRVAYVLVAYHHEVGWYNVQPLVDRLAHDSNTRLVVEDSSGQIVADSRGRAGEPPPAPGAAARVLLYDGGVPVGTVLVFPGANRNEVLFDRTLARALIPAAMVGFAAALALSLLLGRHLARPLGALSAAAHRMSEGNLDQRVPVQGPSEVHELALSFNAMAERLATAQRLRQDMVADVAHELRTPLTVARGYVEALVEGVAPVTNETLEIIRREVLHLQRLVDDLRDLALAESSQLTLERRTLPVADLLDDAAAEFRLQADAKGVALSVSSGDALVDVDTRRIGQVLRNLLANALRYTPEGGSIDLRAALRSGEVEVSVADTGSGIDPADLPYVFERFYRADRSRARRTGGAGLGLAIAKLLVELHGGHMGAESMPAQGSRFWFTLPPATLLPPAT